MKLHLCSQTRTHVHKLEMDMCMSVCQSVCTIIDIRKNKHELGIKQLLGCCLAGRSVSYVTTFPVARCCNCHFMLHPRQQQQVRHQLPAALVTVTRRSYQEQTSHSPSMFYVCSAAVNCPVCGYSKSSSVYPVQCCTVGLIKKVDKN